MKTHNVFIVLAIVFILPAVSISQVSKKAEPAVSTDKISNTDKTRVYERYYQNGSYYADDLKIADDENLYECPVCKGAIVLRDRKIGVSYGTRCWRCEGKGYVIVKIKK